ncbi:MAG: hypothetical protein GQ582_09885 [Methyloprofundus sp.]|nr:hypothetical protein [Methyloprofundus sp.]
MHTNKVTFLIIPILLALSFSLQAETFCVDNSQSFQSSLNLAANNANDNEILIEQGRYIGQFIYYSKSNNSLKIEGGYSQGCTSSEPNPKNTILDADENGTVLYLQAENLDSNITVEGISIVNGYTTKDIAPGLFIKTDGDVNIDKNHFTNNSSEHDNAFYTNDGAALHITGEGDRYINGNNFSKNYSAIYIAKKKMDPVFNNVHFRTAETVNNIEFTNNNVNSSHANNTSYRISTILYAEEYTISENTFENNSVTALYLRGSEKQAECSIEKNAFLNNGSDRSQVGALELENGTCLIKSNHFYKNKASVSGSALYVHGGINLKYIINNIIEENVVFNSINNNRGGGALSGSFLYVEGNEFLKNKNLGVQKYRNTGTAGLYCKQACYIINNVIAGNTSEKNGAGITLQHTSTGADIYFLINNTFYNNQSKLKGGAVYLITSRGHSEDYSFHLKNNIFDHNSATEGSDIYFRNDDNENLELGNLILSSNSFSQGILGFVEQAPSGMIVDDSNIFSMDPLFINTTNYHLQSNSALVDAGDNSAIELGYYKGIELVVENDLDGLSRLRNGQIDLGAFEVQLGEDAFLVDETAAKHCVADYNLNNELNIPCVSVPNPDGSITIYQAGLQLKSSNPFIFSLSSAQLANITHADSCLARYESTGILSIPCLTVQDIFGNLNEYSIEMKIITGASPLSFELISATPK